MEEEHGSFRKLMIQTGLSLGAIIASKKIYDAINEARETSMDSATSNPLYAEDNTGGNNPVFEGN